MSPGTVHTPFSFLGVARTTCHQKPSGPAGPFTPGVPAFLPLVFLVWLSLPRRLFLLGRYWDSVEGEAPSVGGLAQHLNPRWAKWVQIRHPMVAHKGRATSLPGRALPTGGCFILLQGKRVP